MGLVFIFELGALVLLLIGGIWLWYFIVRSAIRRRRMRSWRRIPGEVVASSIYSRRRHHRPQFKVSYMFDGVQFKAKCESPTKLGFSESRGAQSMIDKHPVGSKVNLYVDPDDHSNAYIWLPEAVPLLLMLLPAILLILVAVIGFLSAFNISF